MSRSEFDLLPTEDQLLQAKQHLDGLRFVLQQNSDLLASNKPLSKETSANFDELIKNCARKCKLSIPAYSSQPEDYSDLGLLCVSLFAAYNLKINEAKEERQNCSLINEELSQLKESHLSLQNDYSKVVENAKNIAANSPDADEYARIKQKLNDAEKRLALQSQKQAEELKEMQTRFDTERSRNTSLEKEIEALQAAQINAQRTSVSDAERIGKAFGLSSHNTSEIIDGIKDKFGINKDEGDISAAIDNRITQPQALYAQLLESFGVKPNSRTPQSDITSSVKQAYTNEVILSLSRNYCTSPVKGKSINQAVDNILKANADALKKIIISFALPPNIEPSLIVDALKQKMMVQRSKAFESSLYRPSLSSPATPRGHHSSAQLSPIQTRDLGSVNMPQKGTDSQVLLEKKQEIERLGKENESLLEKLALLEKEKSDALKNKEELTNANENINKSNETLQSENRELKRKISQKNQIFQKKIDQLSEMVNQLADKLLLKKKENLSLKQSEASAMNIVSHLEKSLTQEKDARSQLEDQMNTQISQITEENEQLKQELQTSILQKSAISNLSMESKEQAPSKKMQQIVDEVMDRYQEQSEELIKESTLRKQLLEIIRKQSALLHGFDAEIGKLISSQKAVPVATILSPPRKPTDLDDNAFISVLDNLEVEQDLEAVLSDVQHLANEEGLTTRSRYSNVINHLFDTISKLQKEIVEVHSTSEELDSDKQVTIDRLLSQLKQQTSFIEQMASSNLTMPSELRDQMIESATRAQCFIHNFCTGFIKDLSLYDGTDINISPLEFKEAIDEVFSRYTDIKTNEGKDLLHLLSQSIAVCSVLRRYGTEAQTQIQRLSSEIRKLRSELDSARNEEEKKINAVEEESKKQIEELGKVAKNTDEILASVENILRSNITNEEILRPILLAFQKLKDGEVLYDLNPQEYNDALAKELDRTIKQLDETKSQVDELKVTTTREIPQDVIIEEEEEKGEEEMRQSLSQSQSQSIIDEQKNTIDQLNGEIIKIKEEKSKASSEFEILNHNLSVALQIAEEKNSKLERRSKDIEATIRGKYKSRLDQTIDAVVEDHKIRIEHLQRRIKIVQRDSAKAIAEKDRAIETANQVSQELESVCQQLRELQVSEGEAQAQLSSLKSQLKETTNSQISAQLEVKVLQQRIKSIEERSQREKDSLEAQYSLKQIRGDDEIRARTVRIQEEQEKKSSLFLAKIVSELREFADSSLPITEASILALMSDIYARLKLNARENEKSDDLERQMREIRQKLNAPKGTRTTAVVNDLVDSLVEMKAKILELEKDKKNTVLETSSEEWFEWARRIAYALFAGTIPDSCKELRSKLEEALFASVKEKSFMSKYDSLRYQKQLLKDGKFPDSPSMPANFCSIICSVMFLRRITRMSKHIPTELAIKIPPQVIPNETTKSQSSISKKSTLAPIFARSVNMY